MKKVSRSVARVEMPEHLGEVAVLHDGPDPAAQRGEPQRQRSAPATASTASARMNSRVRGKENPSSSTVPGEPGRARPRRTSGGAEDVAGQLLQHQRDAPGDQQRVQRPVVHPAQQRHLQQHAEQPADDERDRQRRPAATARPS